MHLTAPDEVFTTLEAADFLGKSRRQIQRLLTSGKLEATRPNGRWVISAVCMRRLCPIDFARVLSRPQPSEGGLKLEERADAGWWRRICRSLRGGGASAEEPALA